MNNKLHDNVDGILNLYPQFVESMQDIAIKLPAIEEAIHTTDNFYLLQRVAGELLQNNKTLLKALHTLMTSIKFTAEDIIKKGD